ncbi:MAG: transposase [Muribaculaceae bacterium]|nr:transposase [Muribaculaceae bacterium]
MAQTLSQLYVHICFHRQYDAPDITPPIASELIRYASTICRNLGCTYVRINCLSDHMHMLCSLPTNLCVADLVKKVKTSTSQWIKGKAKEYRLFHWQNGYGAFSASSSVVDATIKYINNQHEHHRGRSYEDELRMFCARYGVKPNDDYPLID